jgi:mannose PTS system EIID component
MNDVAEPPVSVPPRLSLRVQLAMFLRLLAIQGSWNYERLLGTGIGFCTEPALRSMPGGRGGTPYNEALARESSYFNAHPYLAALAVGALARAEVDGAPAPQIERFRAALCGPLGSVGDRLIWAGWLPFSSLLALSAYGLGAGAGLTVLLFLIVYNVGHLGLRAWGLRVGWEQGLRVATALGNPVLRQAPIWIVRAIALLSGLSLPLVLARALMPGHGFPIWASLMSALAAAALVLLHGRLEGWRFALFALLALLLYSVVVR